MRTESKGILDIENIFGKRPTYYVTEFTKAPQLIYALSSLGIDLLGFSGLPEMIKCLSAGIPDQYVTPVR